jgi:hypothetical protein
VNRRGRTLAVAVPMALALALVVGAVVGPMWARRGDGDGGRAAPVVDDSTIGQVRESAGRTAAAGSSRVALDVVVALGVVDASVSGEGVLDLRNGRGHLDLDLPVGSVSGLLDAGNVYVKMPPNPTAKKWAKLDLAEVLPDGASSITPLGRLASSDPARALALLVQSAGDMRRVGTEAVRGVATTHSHGTFEAVGPVRLPLDVWVDGDGRVRKLTVHADPDGAGPLPASSLALELYDFGVAADVVPPPAGQVADVTGPVKAVAELFR